MSGGRFGVRVLTMMSALMLSGCVDNIAPGNDREAELDRPEPPAEVVDVASAIAEVSPGLLKPEIMSDADVSAVTVDGDRCAFRYTEVDFPSFLYGSTGVIKLNGKLATLPAAGEGRWAAGGVEVTVLSREEAEPGAERFPAELVLRLPGAPDELGFHGYSTC